MSVRVNLGTGGGKELGENENCREDSKKWKMPNTGFVLDSQDGKQFAKRRTVAEACFRERCQY